MKEPIKNKIDDWLKNVKQKSVKPSTYVRLRTSFNLMCQYPISDRPLSWITTRDIQLYLNRLVTDGYSLSTIKKQRDLLSAFLRREYSQGRITHPLYLAVEMPSTTQIKKETKEIEAYSLDDQKRLNYILDRYDHLAYIACVLMLECGLRVGEVLALEWDDVIFSQRAIRINKTLVRISSGESIVQRGAKSRTSNRKIPLSARAVKALEYAKANTDGESDYIFPKNDHWTVTENFPMSYHTVKYYILKVCKEAGVKYSGLHIFRHTFATNCYYRGCDVKILSKLLGHADVSITYNIYINLYGDALEEMRKVLG